MKILSQLLIIYTQIAPVPNVQSKATDAQETPTNHHSYHLTNSPHPSTYPLLSQMSLSFQNFQFILPRPHIKHHTENETHYTENETSHDFKE